MTKEPTAVVSVRMPVKLRDRLRKMAEADSRSLNALTVLLLQRGVRLALPPAGPVRAKRGSAGSSRAVPPQPVEQSDRAN